MDLNKLSDPLSIDEIDFRIQSINRGKYATILAYKDARADMQRLDNVAGALNWKREHTRDNKNCIVSIYCEKKKEWVSKEDTGTESLAEKEKGLASDSFKRACFNWGIGRELYDYPVISVQLYGHEVTENNGKFKQSFGLKLREWVWQTSFNGSKLVQLTATDNNGNIRYDSLMQEKPKAPAKKEQPKTPQQPKPKKKTLNDKQFKQSIEALKKGAVTADQFKNYELTAPQNKTLTETLITL
jgi:hypothetical protein